MKTKPNLKILGLIMLGIILNSCGVIPGTSVVTVEPGYAGLKIRLYGKDKGIESADLVSGRVWYNGYTEQVVIFPTFINTYPFTQAATEGSPTDESIIFSVSGSPVSADVGISFGFTTEKLPTKDTSKLHKFYETYRKTPNEFRANELRNGLRNCFSEVAENLNLTPSMLAYNQQKLVAAVASCVQTRFPTVVVEGVTLLGPLRLPPEIQKSIDEQFAAQQAAQTADANRKKAEAEAAANVAKAKGESQVTIEKAKAEAAANRLLSGSITPQLLELERLRVEQSRVEKWNGEQATIIQTPNVQIGSTGTQTQGK